VSDVFSISPEQRATIRILIVDDDRTLREGCASALQIEGYNVTAIGRGDEAIDVVKRRKFDIVLVDLFMTPVPGSEILTATLQANKDTIVVMMTGSPSRRRISRSSSAAPRIAFSSLERRASSAREPSLSTATAIGFYCLVSRRHSGAPWSLPARLRRQTRP
jgi:DNA-binding NtrC family response regulator